MDRLKTLFAQRGWLSRQPPDFRQGFLALGRLLSLERDVPVFRTGDGLGGVFGIVTGAMAVHSGTRWQAPALAHVMRPGDWFGHGPALRGGARSLTFIAAEPTLLLHVPLDRLRAQMQAEPEFLTRVAQMADENTETALWVARDLLIPDSARRVAAVLLRVTALGEVPPDQTSGYPLSQGQLGEMANLSRHQVNRVLGRFQRSGWIACSYGRVALLNVAALKQFAYAEG
jgi:CRP-like cAMP-binding protein